MLLSVAARAPSLRTFCELANISAAKPPIIATVVSSSMSVKSAESGRGCRAILGRMEGKGAVWKMGTGFRRGRGPFIL